MTESPSVDAHEAMREIGQLTDPVQEALRRMIAEFGDEHYHTCPADTHSGECNCFAGHLSNDSRKTLESAITRPAPSSPALEETGIEWMVRTNAPFHAALRKYPDAFEALHFLWNGMLAQSASSAALDPVTVERRLIAAKCTSPDGTYVHASTKSVVEALIGQPAPSSTVGERMPKVRTSHHRNKEEAARLQAIVDERFALPPRSVEAPVGKPAAWGRMINGEAITVSRIRDGANDEPLYASPPPPDTAVREAHEAFDRMLRKNVIEECAKHLEQEADVATNSLHCGDNSQTIAAVHRVSRAYHEAAKSIRALASLPPYAGSRK